MILNYSLVSNRRGGVWGGGGGVGINARGVGWKITLKLKVFFDF